MSSYKRNRKLLNKMAAYAVYRKQQGDDDALRELKVLLWTIAVFDELEERGILTSEMFASARERFTELPPIARERKIIFTPSRLRGLARRLDHAGEREAADTARVLAELLPAGWRDDEGVQADAVRR